MMSFTELFTRAENLGLTEVLLPFLLIFVIVFAVLQKMELLGAGKKNYNVIVAMVIALTPIILHVTGKIPQSYDTVNIINSTLPQVSIIIVAIVMALLLIGLMGGKVQWLGSSFSGVIALLAFLIVLYIFAKAAGWFTSIPDLFTEWGINEDTQALIVIILIFAILIWYITKEDRGDKAKGIGDGFGSFFKGLGDQFKPK